MKHLGLSFDIPKKNKILYLLLCGFLLSCTTIWAQSSLKIEKLNGPIEFDGKLNDKAWDASTPLTLSQNRPDYGAVPSEKSEVMIGYDDSYLWVGARLFMNDPSKIISTTKKRDNLPESSDAFGIMIDGFNDNENGLAFFTTPSGSRFDEAISGDAATGGGRVGGVWKNNWENITWNTFWDVKTSKDDQGWYVEMRIPFSSLKFKPDESKISNMGLIITRVISSRSEVDTWPDVTQKFGKVGNNKPSLAHDITIEGAKPSNPIYITPYVTAGNTRSYGLNDDKTAYKRKNDNDLDVGVDLKYSINSKLTLDVTVNPDFAQVEADDQQVNLTRYSLFLAEKRQFFQERSSLFDFVLDGSSNLFYSRNIGLTPDGQSVAIYGGARLTGRVGKWDIGVMDIQTEKENPQPAENFGVIRARRNVINDYSYVGGIFTSRLGMDGTQNFTYGLDGTWRAFKDDYIDVKIAQTRNDEDANKLSIHNTFALAQWQRRKEIGLGYLLKYYYSGEQFNPTMGYLQQNQMDFINAKVQYGFLAPKQSSWFQLVPSIEHKRYTRLTDNALESAMTTGTIALSSKKQLLLSLAVTYDQEGVKNKYFISSKEGVYVDAGKYNFWYGTVNIQTPKANAAYFESVLKYGEFYDGTQMSVSFAPTISLSQSFQLSATYQYNYVRFKDRDMSANLHNIGVKGTYMFSTKLSASLFTQYASKDDEMITNIRLQYNPKEGNDFYIVFNDARNYKRFQDANLKLPTYNSSTIMLKYTYTFIL